LLVTRYKIPTIFICQKWILQTKYEKQEFVGYGDEGNKFAFVLIPGFRPENVPSYKLIQSNENEVFIKLDKLNGECLDRIREAITNKISINDYLKTFTKPVKTNYEKKKPQKLIIESDTEDIKPDKKTKIIIEETSPVSPEEFIMQPKKKQTRKKLEIKGTKNKTAKNLKKRKVLIVDSSSSS
jgi:hypothetical protein